VFPNQVFFHTAGPVVRLASLLLIETEYFKSEIKNFPDRGATNPAANGFKFGALANWYAPTRHLVLPHTEMKMRIRRI